MAICGRSSRLYNSGIMQRVNPHTLTNTQFTRIFHPLLKAVSRETSGDKKMNHKTRMGFDAQLMECVHTHTHTRARTHTRTHTCTHTHTHTHARTHTHTLWLCDPYCNLSARRVEKVASRFINNRIKMVRHVRGLTSPRAHVCACAVVGVVCLVAS